jgi:hypothetical protein
LVQSGLSRKIVDISNTRIDTAHLFDYYWCMETATPSRSVVDGLVAALAELHAGMPETEFGLCVRQWERIKFDCSVMASCTVDEASAGLVVLEGVRRSLDAVTAVLAARLNAGRDTRAALVRKTGMSSRQANEIVDVVKVLHALPDAEEMLSSGKVSVAHLRPLAHINSELAASVLADAEGMGADQFVTFVKERNTKQNAKSLAEEQEASRSVTFFETKNGCVAARIVLPIADGTEFRETLNQLCDAQYKKDHPVQLDAGPVSSGRPLPLASSWAPPRRATPIQLIA